MEVLPCPGENDIVLVTIDGRTYRQRRIAETKMTKKGDGPNPHAAAFVPSVLRQLEDDLDDSLPIVEGKDDFSLIISAPSQFMGLVIGRQGKTKQNIEQLTGCRLILPGKNVVDEKITIRGPSRKAVSQAHDRLSIILTEARRKAQYTHFISVPLGVDPSIRDAAAKLQNDLSKIASEKAVRGFDPSIAMQPAKLHLTVLMLKLLTQEDIKKASDILQSLAPKIYDAVETRSLLLNVKGLEIMNDDPSSCDVLYLKVSEGNNEKRLERLCALIVSEFDRHGFVDESQQGRPVKLHATLFNSRYRQEDGSSANNQRQSFDARPFLEMGSRVDVGTTKIAAVHLSQRDANDANGYYHCVVKIALP